MMTAVKPSNSLPADISEQLTVLDGSNNEFQFIKKADHTITFEYKPIQPMFSSSGTYSGGTSVFKQLQADEWTKLIDMFRKAKTHAKPNEPRQMGSIHLRYQSGTIDDSCIIAFSSKINQELQTFFHRFTE